VLVTAEGPVFMATNGKNTGRYATDGAESEFQPGSWGKVLRNLAGITSKKKIEQLEFESLIRTQIFYITKILSPCTVLNEDLIRKNHKDWLGKIYEWAGNYRTVNVSKGDFTWPPAYLVSDHMKNFSNGTLKTYTPCIPAPLQDLALNITIVHSEFLLIHPFRDGNGRMARWIADIMAMQAGLSPPNYGFIGQGSDERREFYIKAVSWGYVKKVRLFDGFF